VYVVPPSREAVARFGDSAVIIVAIGRTLAFIIGASFSTIVGQLGMRVAIEGNIRVTSEAFKENYNNALIIAYRASSRPKRAGQFGSSLGSPAHRGRSHLPSRGSWSLLGRRHLIWPTARYLYGHLWWGTGQCQEVHLVRSPWRQRLASTQGRYGRGYGW
jgi:hypothetical protein